MCRHMSSPDVAGAVFVTVLLAGGVAGELPPLRAALVSFQLTGTLRSARNNGATAGEFALAPEVVAGAPFTGLLTYDLDLPGVEFGSPYTNSYSRSPLTATMGLSITVGSQTFLTAGQDGSGIFVSNAAPPEAHADCDPASELHTANCLIPRSDGFSFSSSRFDQVGYFHETVSFRLVDATGNAFSSSALPSMLDVANFDEREIQFIRTSGVSTNVYPGPDLTGLSLIGRVDTITLVPEPSAAVLAGLGLLAWRVLSRKSKLPPRRAA